MPHPVTHTPTAGQRAAQIDVNDDTQPTSGDGQQQENGADGIDVWLIDVERRAWMAFCTRSEADKAIRRLREYAIRTDPPKLVTVKDQMYCAWCGERIGGFHERLGFQYTVAAWEACAIILAGLRPTGVLRIPDWLYDSLEMTWCGDPGPERPAGFELAEWAFTEFNL